MSCPPKSDGILKIRVAEGETIGIGTVIAELEAPPPGCSGCRCRAAASAPAADPIDKGEENPAASDQAGYGGTPAGGAAAPGRRSCCWRWGSVEMKIPNVGESIAEVTVAKWLKEDGAQVSRDEVIAELESDKATFELPAKPPVSAPRREGRRNHQHRGRDCAHRRR